MMLYADTVTRVRAPYKTDKYGNTFTERDWAHAVRTAVSGVSFQPDVSTEATGDRPSVITGYRLISRKGVDVDLLPTDRIEADGMTLEVDGKVGRFRVAGRVHHIEARLKEVSG
ncbi:MULTISPECIES: hypothetical protein [Streptomyces]|uniref:hypothetical protein n=1 Tax=Streptomyces TaxID=1883 RepID=UPI0015FF9CBE|nr:hypothetical protein [Streptomyces murinus]MBA9050783.1 hypothetical protein [Streptomyces murinus]